MTSPNEPGYAGPGDTPNGNGSIDREPADAAAVPRKRTGPRPSQPPQRQSDGPLPRPAGRASASPNAEARLNRFISGSAAPGPAKSPAPEAEEPMPTPASCPTCLARFPVWDNANRLPEESADLTTSRGRTQVSSRPRGPVRASMQIRRIDPWSTLKVSLILSVALFFVWMIAVAFLYLVLGGMGVWSKLNSNVGDLLNNSGGSAELVSSGTIFGGAFLIGLVNIVLLTAAATIGAFIYNLTTDLIGGVEVTLADRD